MSSRPHVTPHVGLDEFTDKARVGNELIGAPLLEAEWLVRFFVTVPGRPIAGS